MHQQLYSQWLPHHGTCVKTDDEYMIRGGYATSIMICVNGDAGDMSLEAQKKYLPEYLRVRPYFSQNFYALTEPSKNRDVWCVSQYHNTEEEKGMIQIFKRELSFYDTATYNLREIDENATYLLEDIDEGITEISGAELKNFTVTIKGKRVAKIYLYSKKQLNYVQSKA